jgi:hypothetical protein
VLPSALSLLRKSSPPIVFRLRHTSKHLLIYNSGGNQFSKITDGNCMVPQNLQGEVYMMITKTESVKDDQVLAGPSVIQPS